MGKGDRKMRKYWNDPDDDICSGIVEILEIKGEVVKVRRPNTGDVFEGFDFERSPLEDS